VKSDITQLLRQAEESFNQADYENSVHCCEQILLLEPDNSQVRINLSKLYFRLGQFELGQQQSLYLIQKYPRFLPAYTDYLINIGYYIDDPKKISDLHVQLMSHYLRHVGYEPCKLPLEHWASTETLRIGILSADFREHAMCGFLSGLVESLCCENVELFAYTFHKTQDHFTEHFKKQFHKWRDITSLDTPQATKILIEDRIHFLIDTNAFTNGGRLDVTMNHPALLQATWLGYLNTTGLPCYEFKLTDKYLTPIEMQKYYSEKFLYVDTALPFVSRVQKSRIREENHSHMWTMASFNNIQKIRPEMLQVWTELLRKIPNSLFKMVIPANEKTRDTLISYFVQSGISPHQLQILPEGSFEKFIGYMDDVDIALDPFPHSGGATTAHALSVGLPTVTIEGATEQGRIGSSLLKQNDGENYVVHSVDQYIKKVIDLAKQERSQPLYLKKRTSNDIVEIIREQVEMAIHQKKTFSK
jgi:protein O-GlcNAc transferase